jgi:hypothetical protein
MKILNILVDGQIVCVKDTEIFLYKINNGKLVGDPTYRFEYEGATNPESIKNFFLKNFLLDFKRLLILGIWEEEESPKYYMPFDVAPFIYVKKESFQPIKTRKNRRINHG